MPNNWKPETLEKLVIFLSRHDGRKAFASDPGDRDRVISFISDHRSIEEYHILFVKKLVKVGRQLALEGRDFNKEQIETLYCYAVDGINRIPNSMDGKLKEHFTNPNHIPEDTQWTLLSHFEKDAGHFSHLYAMAGVCSAEKMRWMESSYKHYGNSTAYDLNRKKFARQTFAYLDKDLLHLVNAQIERVRVATELVSMPILKTQPQKYDALFKEVNDSTLETHSRYGRFVYPFLRAGLLNTYSCFLAVLYDVTGSKRLNVERAMDYVQALHNKQIKRD